MVQLVYDSGNKPKNLSVVVSNSHFRRKYKIRAPIDFSFESLAKISNSCNNIRMQIKQSNFFPTQIPGSLRYSQTLSLGQSIIEPSSRLRNPAARIRQAKAQARKAESMHSQKMREYMKLRNSLDKSNNDTCKLRNQFLKLYEIKKVKHQNRTLIEDFKDAKLKALDESCSRAHRIKLEGDLGILYAKNELEAQSEKMRDQNRKAQDKFKKKLALIRRQEEQEARQKFEKTKRGQTEFLIRKKNLSAIVSTRAHHNYLTKLNKQLEILGNYQNLLDKLSAFREAQDILQGESGAEMGKTFFQTTRNTFI